MYLLHTIFGHTPEKVDNILREGYLKSSKKTHNYAMFGDETPYIYLRLQTPGDVGHLYLDTDLLLNCVFYLNIGWHAGIDKSSVKYNGRDLTHEQLDEILQDFYKKVTKYRRDINKVRKTILIDPSMSNEILVRKDISLKKYLRKFSMYKSSTSKKTKELLATEYSEVEIL